MTNVEIEIPYKFKCRPYQKDAWRAIESQQKRLVCCWHRGCGKDLLFLNALICQAIERPGVYLHCFPKYNQGKKAIWNSVHETHNAEMMSYLDHFPKDLVKHKNASDMMIKLHNGSVYCIMGLDGKNATQARGMNPTFIILSEYAYMDPESWYTIEPRISQNNGTAIFLSTPNGQNHFYHLFNYAKAHPKEYFSSLLTINDTGTLSNEHIDRLRSEGVPEDFIQQEYYCSFTRGAEGSYYGKQIQKARDEDRITTLPIVPDLPVFTSWDIGIGDSTSIWVFQCLPNGKYNFLDYYENNGEGLEHYIRYLDRWRSDNCIIWGRHFVPHDMGNKQMESGNDLVFTARRMGLDMTIVPRKSIEEGIQAVRSMLSQCSFHETKCKRGIQCLDFYRKKWNDQLKVYYDEPLHDQWSHGCFVKGTKITLEHCEKAIEDIKKGDYVRTPTGVKKVVKTFEYDASQLYHVGYEGQKLTGTGNHKVFTENGLKHIDELMHNDILYTQKDDSLCKKIGFLGREKGLGFRDIFSSLKMKQRSISMDTDTDGMVFISEQPKEKEILFLHSIELFGHFTTALFQKVTIFITSIKILKIIQLKTCNAYPRTNISVSLLKQTSGSDQKLIKPYAEATAKSLKNGIEAMREELGIKSTVKIHGKQESGLLSYVNGAVKKVKLHIQKRLSYVLVLVEQLKDWLVESTISKKNALSANKHLRSTNINLKSQKPVLELVQVFLEKPVKVYDFEVEEDHCYYANGILVSNSDAFRYAAIGLKTFGDNPSSRLNKEQIDEMRKRNLGY